MTDKQETIVWGDEEERECCVCGDTFIGMGNNPDPLGIDEEDRCCDPCNWAKVIPARLRHQIRYVIKVSVQPGAPDDRVNELLDQIANLVHDGRFDDLDLHVSGHRG